METSRKSQRFLMIPSDSAYQRILLKDFQAPEGYKNVEFLCDPFYVDSFYVTKKIAGQLASLPTFFP